jgi:hypothetical protein
MLALGTYWASIPTATEANKALGREGQFWQKDYFDRFIRTAEALRLHCELHK